MSFPSLQLSFADSSKTLLQPPYETIGWAPKYHLPLLLKPRHKTKGAPNLRAKLIAKALSLEPTGKRTLMEFLLQNLTVSTFHYSSNRFAFEELLMGLPRKKEELGWISRTLVARDWLLAHNRHSMNYFSPQWQLYNFQCMSLTSLPNT